MAAWQNLLSSTNATFSGIASWAQSYWETIKGTISSRVQETLNVVIAAWQNLLSSTNATFSGIVSWAQSAWSSVRDAIVSNISSAVSQAQGLWSQLVNAAQSAWNTIQSLWNAAKNAVSSFPSAPSSSSGGGGSSSSGYYSFPAGQGQTANVTWQEPATSTGQASGGFLTKQHGGEVFPGVPYMVGEAGTELFVPREHGRIVPNNALGGTNVTINFNAPVYGVDDLEKAIDLALQRLRWHIRSIGG
jgi:hypothetical protein